MRALLESTTQRALAYLEKLDSRAVAPPDDAVAGLTALDEPLPERPSNPESVVRVLDEICSPATLAMAGPRFFGFVIGGSLPAALAANWLAGAWDQNSALYNITSGPAVLEQVSLRWLRDVLNLPEGCAGAFVTGATIANFCALAAESGVHVNPGIGLSCQITNFVERIERPGVDVAGLQTDDRGT